MTTKKMSLRDQAEAIKKAAEEKGLESNYFFITTFERYEIQLGVLDKLKETIKNEPTLVEKEYVKNRGNVYVHPAVTEFNRTTDSANKTVSTLMRILKNFDTSAGGGKERDDLLDIINGGDDDAEGDRE